MGNMTEYDQLCRILSDDFKESKENIMIEDKGNIHKVQSVYIDDEDLKNIRKTLYRFDLEKKEFMPFFNKTDNSPEGLRKFCDYVLLVNYRDTTYVLLIELKRGGADGADKQLRASETFIKFLYKTAERLYKDFDDFNFDIKKIVLRKIIIKACKSNKQKIQSDKVDLNQDIIRFKSSGIFPLFRFLK